MNYCKDGGPIVGPDDAVPEDPSTYYNGGKLIGCNRLRCSRCKERVRSRVGFMERDGAWRFRNRIYESADWNQAPWLMRNSLTRLYVCRCGMYSSSGWYDPEREQRAIAGGGSQNHWTCEGHLHRAKRPKSN